LIHIERHPNLIVEEIFTLPSMTQQLIFNHQFFSKQIHSLRVLQQVLKIDFMKRRRTLLASIPDCTHLHQCAKWAWPCDPANPVISTL
jgi:hypothetical protein